MELLARRFDFKTKYYPYRFGGSEDRVTNGRVPKFSITMDVSKHIKLLTLHIMVLYPVYSSI